MAETVANQICELLDQTKGELIYEEDDDDLLEHAIRLFHTASLTSDELAAIKERFDNALFRTNLHAENVWFHSQLRKAYNNFIRYMSTTAKGVSHESH